MEWQLSDHERTYLRDLAKKQADYAALPVMAERKKMWYALNDGSPTARPPVVIETWTFDRDFMPEGVFQCTSQAGKAIERQLLNNIRNYELINDDKVMPDTFNFGWFVDIDEFGVSIPTETRKDSQGVETAYRFLHPIKDLKRDLALLKPAKCRVDREKTAARKEFLEDLFGGILPVALRTGVFGSPFLTNRVIELMGMEAFFLAMYDCPDELHQLMAYLRDNSLLVMRWAQSEGLLRLNNANQDAFGSSYNFTTALPAAGYQPPAARLCDMFGSANSQETVSVSPAMFHDFCFPYYRDAVAPLGLLYYGCCEPVHPFWGDLQRLPHLKKISISRWCDETFMGQALQGTGVIFSRKPDPRFLGVDVKLDEAGWKASIRASLKAARGVGVEFIVRDVYTVHGDLSKPRRAAELARQVIDQR